MGQAGNGALPGLVPILSRRDRRIELTGKEYGSEEVAEVPDIEQSVGGPGVLP